MYLVSQNYWFRQNHRKKMKDGGDTQTYVDYGCAPENMLENCRINIVDDISKKPTVSLPEKHDCRRHYHTNGY